MSQPILVPVAQEISAADESESHDDDRTALLVREALPSWLTSLVFHLTLVLLLALFGVMSEGSWKGSVTIDLQAGAGGSDEYGNGDGLLAGMETASDLPAATAALAEAPGELADFAAPAVDAVPQIALADLSTKPIGPPGGANTGSVDGIPDGHGRGGGDADDGADGAGEGSGGEGGTGPARTGIFGLVAEGTKFIYVFDHSESMNSTFSYTSEGSTVFSVTPLEAAKAELLKSLDDLDARQQFHIVFYNHDSWWFDAGRSSRRMVKASRENKRRAASFIAGIPGIGNTNHMPPLEMALRMKPDVIFLLTDGEVKDDPTPAQLRMFQNLNHGRTKINVIQFCYTPQTGSALIQLAQDNGGKHTFMNIARLAPKGAGMDPGAMPPDGSADRDGADPDASDPAKPKSPDVMAPPLP